MKGGDNDEYDMMSSSCLEMSSCLQQLSVATTEFALALLREVGSSDCDAILSPLSIAVALAMTYAGAAGNTAAQMNKVAFSGRLC